MGKDYGKNKQSIKTRAIATRHTSCIHIYFSTKQRQVIILENKYACNSCLPVF